MAGKGSSREVPMLIDVRNTLGSAPPEMRRYVELRLESGLGPLLSRFDRITVAVVEGRSARVPARCRIIGHLEPDGRALVEHTHPELFEAVDGAVRRLAAEVGGSPTPEAGRRTRAA